MADNKQEPCYYSKPSADCKKIHFDYQCLKSMTPFILSLVIPFVGFKFKILRISWYKCMKPFRYNLQLIINKYLCQCHNSFPVIEYNSNQEVLSGMSKYNYSQNQLNIFELAIYLFT